VEFGSVGSEANYQQSALDDFRRDGEKVGHGCLVVNLDSILIRFCFNTRNCEKRKGERRTKQSTQFFEAGQAYRKIRILNTRLKQYLITIEAKFEAPRQIENIRKTMIHGPQPAVAGYFRNFGVTALNRDEAESFVVNEAEEPGTTISIENAKEVEVSNLDDSIKRHFQSNSEVGIWYRSGRGYFPAEPSQ
jgi:hypothetical protein